MRIQCSHLGNTPISDDATPTTAQDVGSVEFVSDSARNCSSVHRVS